MTKEYVEQEKKFYEKDRANLLIKYKDLCKEKRNIKKTILKIFLSFLGVSFISITGLIIGILNNIVALSSLVLAGVGLVILENTCVDKECEINKELDKIFIKLKNDERLLEDINYHFTSLVTPKDTLINFDIPIQENIKNKKLVKTK